MRRSAKTSNGSKKLERLARGKLIASGSRIEICKSHENAERQEKNYCCRKIDTLTVEKYKLIKIIDHIRYPQVLIALVEAKQKLKNLFETKVSKKKSYIVK